MDNKNQIITEARSWIGTKFHHQGRIKKTFSHNGGCDCIGFVIGVADNIGLKFEGKPYSFYDDLDYPKYPHKNKLEQVIQKFMIKIDESSYQTGDVLLFKFDKNPQHVGLVSYHNNIIHCYAQAKGVVEHQLDKSWKEKIIGYYSFS